jgi:hypothetical protein
MINGTGFNLLSLNHSLKYCLPQNSKHLTIEQQEQKQRDWIYILPGGQSAENMKSGRMILSELAS